MYILIFSFENVPILKQIIFFNAEEIPWLANVFGVLIELDFIQNKFGVLYGDQKDYSYLTNCLTGNVPSNGSIFFIAVVCIAIIPFKNYVYLFDSNNWDVFGMPNQNRFSICIKFRIIKVLHHTYTFCLLVLPSFNMKTSLKCIINDFSNEAISISLIHSKKLLEDKQNLEDKKEELNVGITINLFNL